ncbi:Alpha/beta hydrolase family-domain-containing protein [Aspergillus avenaceus]|uniref:Alpha/beta hydrolase family-domain-containing protein n=1 Tax=Aspergillus avenaceus TaxID=36643 RepID=A0A5N6TZ13_ASPAV|nr:Alpha/beta hydrolase family-domain-containing protein [Aspergillus avenaceus]
MVSSPFTVTEHVVDCQHIREYPHATRAGDDVLKLVVKQYKPKSNPNPKSGDLTIIGAHGGGFPKELYEPLWEDILKRSEHNGIRIRSIWIADVANHGASGELNAERLGHDQSWLDHSRDLLYFINQFKEEMPRPIVGIGHSLGAGQLALLSLIHPRLFTSLVLIEPVIEKSVPHAKGAMFTQYALGQKSTWKTHIEAETYFKKLYKNWEPRVLEKWLEYGLRKQAATGSDKGDTPVMLTTSKHHEVVHYMRPNFFHKRPLDPADEESTETHDSCFYPDIIGPPGTVYPFYHHGTILMWGLLKHVRPSVLYVFGEKCPLSTPSRRRAKLERTGIGIGGSGGLKRGRVKEVVIPKTGHQNMFEDVTGVADASVDWLKNEMIKWKEDEERITKGWAELSPQARVSVADDWKTHLDACLTRPNYKPRSKL